MFNHKTALTPLLFALQYILVHWAAQCDLRPAPPDPACFPARFASWVRFTVDPDSVEQAKTLRSKALLNWTYIQTDHARASSANLFVAWFASQKDGDAFIHRPEVCLPANGWIGQSSDTAKIETGNGVISATRVVIARGGVRQVVLYWYQTPKRTARDLWELKFGLAVDLLAQRRSDVALVRVVTQIDKETESATAVAVDFARGAFPLLRGWLPR